MRIIGNLIWLICGGFISAIEYLIAGVFYCITIIGVPIGLQCFKFASVAIWPFGTKVVSKPDTGIQHVLLNIIWLILGGLGICLTHILLGLILSITIIGLPWGKQHFKLAKLAFTPFSYNID